MTPPWVEQRFAELQVGCEGLAQLVMVAHSHVVKSLQARQPPQRPPTVHAGNRTGLVQLELPADTCDLCKMESAEVT